MTGAALHQGSPRPARSHQCKRSASTLLTVSALLYTRVPEALKEALAAHAAGRGLSQTRAMGARA
jgi:hypothetical protein